MFGPSVFISIWLPNSNSSELQLQLSVSKFPPLLIEFKLSVNLNILQSLIALIRSFFF